MSNASGREDFPGNVFDGSKEYPHNARKPAEPEDLLTPTAHRPPLVEEILQPQITVEIVDMDLEKGTGSFRVTSTADGLLHCSSGPSQRLKTVPGPSIHVTAGETLTVRMPLAHALSSEQLVARFILNYKDQDGNWVLDQFPQKAVILKYAEEDETSSHPWSDDYRPDLDY